MATKKKTKTKTKKTKKKTSARKAAPKRVARKPAAKKAAAKKRLKRTAAKRPAPKPGTGGQPVRPAARAPAPASVAPVAPPPGERIGVVTHYFNHLSVAIIDLESGGLRVGDVVHIKGHTTDFTQRVESMEVDHVHVNEVRAGQSFGLRIREHAREHDVVYKVAH